RQRAGHLDRREAALDTEGHALAERRQSVEVNRRRLAQEAEDLEGRIRSARRILHDLEERAARLLGVPGEAPPAVAASAETPAVAGGAVNVPAPAPRSRLEACRLAELDVWEEELADQRLQLAAQMERLMRAEHLWQQDREAALAELESVAHKVGERERAV